MTTGCRLLFLVALSTTILCNSLTHGGPARSFALVAARASKIPRSIRAPFRNNEMMTARGFGKRSQLAKFKEGEVPWSFGKQGDSKFYNDLIADGDTIDEIFNDQSMESFPVDWLATEMASNPALAHAILHRFVDANKDGIVTAHEMLAPLSSSTFTSTGTGGVGSQSSLSSSSLPSGIDANDIFIN